jgi:MFS family permease
MKKQAFLGKSPQPTAGATRSPPPAGLGTSPLGCASLLVVAIYAVVLAGVTLPTPLYVVFQDRWSLTNASVTGLYALYPAGVLLVLLTAGHLTDVLGRRVVVGIALFLSGLSALIFVVAGEAWMVACARLLTGLASGFAVNGANALLVELAPAPRRRGASVLSTMVNQLGLGLGALVSAVLVQYAWQPTRLVFAGHFAAIAVASALLWLVPETARRSGRLSVRIQPIRLPIQRRREFVAASLAAFAAFALCGLLAALSPAIAREQLQSTNAILSGGAVALVFVTSGLSQVLWVRIRDRLALLIGALILVGSLALMTFGLSQSSAPLFLTSVTVGGIAVGALFMSSLAIVNHAAADDSRGRTTATYFAITFSGLIVPVIGTGLAADYLSQFGATLAFGAMITAVTIVAVLLLPPSMPGQESG